MSSSTIQIEAQTTALDSKSSVLMKFHKGFKYSSNTDIGVPFTIFNGKIYEAISESIPIGTDPTETRYWKIFKSSGGAIDDNIVSTDTSWSSSKIMEELDGLSTDNIFPELSLFTLKEDC